jgi:hypothetical protein
MLLFDGMINEETQVRFSVVLLSIVPMTVLGEGGWYIFPCFRSYFGSLALVLGSFFSFFKKVRFELFFVFLLNVQFFQTIYQRRPTT